MRRKSLLLCLMFMSILGMTAHSNVDNTVPHRKVYGFFLRGSMGVESRKWHKSHI